VHGGQGLVDFVLQNVGNIFSQEQLESYVKRGILGKSVLEEGYGSTKGAIKAKLDYVANPKRRDVWFTIVKDMCKDFLRTFCYANFSK
jgi:hypothetical protein